jgi:hypothetical protein
MVAGATMVQTKPDVSVKDVAPELLLVKLTLSTKVVQATSE